MTRFSALFLSLALAASPAMGAPAPATGPRQANPFAGLWTGWNGANRDSIAAEEARIEQVRREVAAADAAARARIMDEGRDLGERVGEMVRLGDCAGGERVAREAGDFPLVAAVRSHCGQAVQASTRSR